MEQFSLDKYLENPSRKVVTRDGREVEIFYYNTDKTLLVGRISPTEIHQYTKDGFQYEDMCQAKNDLFFADEELTEFEKVVQSILNEPHFQDEQAVKQISKTLLDLARKELQPEFDKEMDKMLAETDKVVYQKGQQDALKDLPKWKKCGDNLPYSHIGGLNERYLIKNCYCIKISDLETLPKEE